MATMPADHPYMRDYADLLRWFRAAFPRRHANPATRDTVRANFRPLRAYRARFGRLP